MLPEPWIDHIGGDRSIKADTLELYAATPQHQGVTLAVHAHLGDRFILQGAPEKGKDFLLGRLPGRPRAGMGERDVDALVFFPGNGQAHRLGAQRILVRGLDRYGHDPFFSYQFCQFLKLLAGKDEAVVLVHSLNPLGEAVAQVPEFQVTEYFRQLPTVGNADPEIFDGLFDRHEPVNMHQFFAEKGHFPVLLQVFSKPLSFHLLQTVQHLFQRTELPDKVQSSLLPNASDPGDVIGRVS